MHLQNLFAAADGRNVYEFFTGQPKKKKTLRLFIHRHTAEPVLTAAGADSDCLAGNEAELAEKELNQNFHIRHDTRPFSEGNCSFVYFSIPTSLRLNVLKHKYPKLMHGYY